MQRRLYPIPWELFSLSFDHLKIPIAYYSLYLYSWCLVLFVQCFYILSCVLSHVIHLLLFYRTIDRRKRVLIAMDAAFGMEYLHEKNIVHFDLKSHNFFMNMRDPHRPVCKVINTQLILAFWLILHPSAMHIEFHQYVNASTPPTCAH